MKKIGEFIILIIIVGAIVLASHKWLVDKLGNSGGTCVFLVLLVPYLAYVIFDRSLLEEKYETLKAQVEALAKIAQKVEQEKTKEKKK